MRTTVTLDDDVMAEIDRVRRAHGIGVSEAVNRLLREGLARPTRRETYEHRSAELGIKLDVSNVGEVLDLLDDE